MLTLMCELDTNLDRDFAAFTYLFAYCFLVAEDLDLNPYYVFG